jgi:hypothetical protein
MESGERNSHLPRFLYPRFVCFPDVPVNRPLALG